MIQPFREEQIAGRVESHLIRFVELSGRCGTTIAGIARFARARNRADLSVGSNLANRMVARIAKIERSVGAAHKSKRIVELCLDRRSAVALVSRRTGPGEGGHLPWQLPQPREG